MREQTGVGGRGREAATDKVRLNRIINRQYYTVLTRGKIRPKIPYDMHTVSLGRRDGLIIAKVNTSSPSL